MKQAMLLTFSVLRQQPNEAAGCRVLLTRLPQGGRITAETVEEGRNRTKRPQKLC